MNDRFCPTDPSFWNKKRVLLTGHTGFKGSWMSIWLKQMGAELTGYSLNPPTSPSLFEDAEVASGMNSVIGDVRDLDSLLATFRSCQPEIVIHMAAQPLVRESYKLPVETYAINVMGTVNVLEAVRQTSGVKAVVIVTTDKCYENREWFWGYREDEAMGGYDPYSNSKGCAELVTSSYRRSYFHPDRYAEHGVAVASARAGNVIGGGDWADDRLIPDIMRAVIAGEPVFIRSPYATRPWQHVLEPVGGYLLLAEKLYTYSTPRLETAADIRNKWRYRKEISGRPKATIQIDKIQPHEAGYLKLDISKIEARLGWRPVWAFQQTIEQTVSWYKRYTAGESAAMICADQLAKYISDSKERS